MIDTRACTIVYFMMVSFDCAQFQECGKRTKQTDKLIAHASA